MHPIVLCLLFAEEVRAGPDVRSSVIGIFNGYSPPAFPAATGRSWLYLTLTGGHGEAVLTLRLLDSTDEGGPPLFAQDVPPQRFASPWEVKELALEVPAIPLPGPGLYRWQVLCGGEVLCERRLLAQLGRLDR